MLENCWQLAMHTPAWVYVVFIALLRIGFKASKTRVVSFFRLLMMPLFFMFMSVETLVTSLKINSFTVTALTLSLLIGMVLGILQLHILKIQVDPKNRLITLPGTWTTMIIIMIVFVSKYYLNYELAIDPLKSTQVTFIISMLAVSGICTGLFVGRLFYCFYRLVNLHVKTTA